MKLSWFKMAVLVSVVWVAEGGSIDLSREVPVPANEPIPTVDFFRPVAMRGPKLNPSGTHLAAIVTAQEDRRQLLVTEIGSPKPEVVMANGDRDIDSVTWLGDKRVAFTLSTHKLWGLGLFAANVGRLRESYPLLQYYGSSLVAVPKAEPTEPLIWCRWGIDSDKEIGCVTLNSAIDTGHFVDLNAAGVDVGPALSTLRDENEKHILKRYPVPEAGIGEGYLADKDGNLEFAIRMDNAGYSRLFRLEEGEWVRCPLDIEKYEVVSCGEEPGQLLVLAPGTEHKPWALQLADATTGNLGEVLFQDEAYDFYSEGIYHGSIYRDPVSRRIVGIAFDRRAPEVFWFTEVHQKLQKALDSLFPGLVVRIASMNDAQNRFIVEVFSDRQPTSYYWVDLGQRSRGLIKNTRPWIDPARMLPRNVMKFKTRDGHQLDAYLTLPAGVSKKNPAPMVVLPHGGPWARDGWEFDAESQFLASRGYIVLQPNYRGSDGYAWQFPAGDKFDFWKMHEDVTDATKTLLASGLVKKNEVAIMGSSFGGYLALSGVVNDPDLYCCAITIAGVSDWELDLRTQKYDEFDSPGYRFFFRHLGDPKKNPEMYDRISPGRHADRIKVPVYVAAGREDSRVDFNQAKKLISALEKNKVPHQSLFLHWEGHGMANLDDRVKMYDQIAAFLDKCTKQAETTATPAQQ